MSKEGFVQAAWSPCMYVQLFTWSILGGTTVDHNRSPICIAQYSAERWRLGFVISPPVFLRQWGQVHATLSVSFSWVLLKYQIVNKTHCLNFSVQPLHRVRLRVLHRAAGALHPPAGQPPQHHRRAGGKKSNSKFSLATLHWLMFGEATQINGW